MTDGILCKSDKFAYRLRLSIIIVKDNDNSIIITLLSLFFTCVYIILTAVDNTIYSIL